MGLRLLCTPLAGSEVLQQRKDQYGDLTLTAALTVKHPLHAGQRSSLGEQQAEPLLPVLPLMPGAWQCT